MTRGSIKDTKKTNGKNGKNGANGSAMLYHSLPKPGKLEVVATKPLSTQEDLSLAYTPGVAEVCLKIKEDAAHADTLTTRSNLVAVVTNGTAVLGLGNIGPLASKPVMEGKAVLFKKFAGIDVFDIEIEEKDPQKLIETVARLEPTFGGINLEDIKAPECFVVEKALEERMGIPVFHDDQHGTAIILTAAFLNSLRLTKKKPGDVKIVCTGAGAAGIACMKMLLTAGVKKKNIFMVDIDGVVYKGREQMNEYLEEFAQDTKYRTLGDAIEKADVFIGLSAGGILKKEMVKKMAKNPVILAMANPTPEITPEEVAEVRNDVIMGTGRSDYPNQVNNVLCFPFVFRGALDVGARNINMEMKMAAAEAIAELARKAADATLDTAYKNHTLVFGPEYIIPKPFDPRLISVVAPAVAKAAMDTGVARRPIADLDQYARNLKMTVDQSFSLMQQIMRAAQQDPKKVVFPDGEDHRVIRAAQVMAADRVCHPMLIGNRDKIMDVIKTRGLDMEEGKDFTLVDPKKYPAIEDYIQVYYDMRKRDGISTAEAEIIMRYRWAALAAMMVRQGDADAMVGGFTGKFVKFLSQAEQIIGRRDDVCSVYALQALLKKGQIFFIGDTNVNVDPTAEQISELAVLSAEAVERFGIDPKVALLSHSHFGSQQSPSSLKMKKALALVKDRAPELLVEGEMQADAAVDPEVMERTFPDSDLKEPANILIMPNLDAASISFNLLKSTSERVEQLGPILLGMKKPVHIVAAHASVRQIVNLSALAVVEAQNI